MQIKLLNTQAIDSHIKVNALARQAATLRLLGKGIASSERCITHS